MALFGLWLLFEKNEYLVVSIGFIALTPPPSVLNGVFCGDLGFGGADIVEIWIFLSKFGSSCRFLTSNFYFFVTHSLFFVGGILAFVTHSPTYLLFIILFILCTRRAFCAQLIKVFWIYLINFSEKRFFYLNFIFSFDFNSAFMLYFLKRLEVLPMNKYIKLLLLACLVCALAVSCVACGAPNLDNLKTKLEKDNLTAVIVENVAEHDLSLNMQNIFASQVPSFDSNQHIVKALVAYDVKSPAKFAIVILYDDADEAKSAMEYIETHNDSFVKRSGKSLFVASTQSLLKTIA